MGPCFVTLAQVRTGEQERVRRDDGRADDGCHTERESPRVESTDTVD
jgi:hypothetical protein